MPEEVQNIGEAYQELSKQTFDATVRSFSEVNKGFQALAAEVTDYSKKAFDDGIHTWEQLVGVKSVDQAVEIQSQYAKRAYDRYVGEVSKLSDMCIDMARKAYKPVEQAGRKVA
jgi:hypothetical protein